jgi:hypothetical protein
MTSLTELFKTILRADQEESRLAARGVRKLLYSGQKDRSVYDGIKKCVADAPVTYATIVEDWRRENFVMSVSVIYFLHHREDRPDFLFPWLFELLQHENGNIRHAAVRMIENELGPLTYHIRFPREQSRSRVLSADKADAILLGLYISLNNLLVVSWKPSYKKYEYINDLPSSTYKSASLIMGVLEDDCGQSYMKKMIEYLRQELKQ